jgi:phosphoribosyl-AMP cyclohydrolase
VTRDRRTQALAAALVSDRPDGLVPTVVVDEDMVSLGLCYSSKESLEEAIKRRLGVYWRFVNMSGRLSLCRLQALHMCVCVCARARKCVRICVHQYRWLHTHTNLYMKDF